MNNLKNRVNLIGHLGMNPQVRETGNGRKVARFTLATSESYRNSKGDKITETQWHNVVAWGNQASFAGKYMEKGQQVAVEGKLTHRDYKDSKGEKHYITEVVVNEILILKYRDQQQNVVKDNEAAV
ncbi:MAG: single-stranded DNA-binding protein [Chlorobi bacterium]|nr:single-stranded DNA-binding protein [Chlorobiota bacterium]